jgi:hypothetical protein
MNILSKVKLVLAALTSSMLMACGGGGSETAVPVASKNTFDFQTGWRAFLQAAYTKNLNITGSCTGTLTYRHNATSQPSEFDYSDLSFPHPPGTLNPGYVVSQTQQTEAALTGCNLTSSSSINTAYYDGLTYAPFGYVGGTAYNGATSYKGTFREFSSRVTLPNTVKVGDAGSVGTSVIFGTYNFKKDGISQGRYDITYTIEPHTANTAIINIISKGYDTANVMTITDETRYLIDSTNRLTLHSIEQQVFDSIKLKIFAN